MAATTPLWLQAFWPRRLWKMPRNPQAPTLYLTFDDGPTPGVTDWILDLLDQYQAKATFFAVGEQAQRHPELLQEVHRRGHRIGSHTQHHLNGWKTDSRTYLGDVHAGNQSLESILTSEKEPVRITHFRPPYGRIRSREARQIQDQTIVMWNVLAADWRQDLSPEQVARRVTAHGKDGSIVVFHDSLKAEPRVKGALPTVLEKFQTAGFTFSAL